MNVALTFRARARGYPPWFRGVTFLVGMAFVTLVVWPPQASASASRSQTERRSGRTTPPAETTDEIELSRLLDQIDETLALLRAESPRARASLASRDVGTLVATIGSLRERLVEVDARVRRNFRDIEAHIERSGLPPVILERHRVAATGYLAESDGTLRALRDLENAGDVSDRDARIREAYARVRSRHRARSAPPFDPTKLPFRVPDDEARAPKRTFGELQAFLDADRTVVVASSRLTAGMAQAPVSSEPEPADLEPTVDVQITPDIIALAGSLENNPVQIFNWVHDHIEFMPTYGSIQGSQGALETGRGNAFDTASLLVALLRAAGIPARYVYGTIEVPVEQAMNWVGGVDVAEAAMQLFGQGGVPNTGIVRQGRVSGIELEHVWVEAWVDFEPSRGARNRAGDRWVSLDASFKQHRFTDGMDLSADVPFDVEGFARALTESSTSDPGGNWIAGVDQTLIESELGGYLSRAEAFFESTDPDVDEDELLGTKTIVATSAPVLPSGLPYHVVVRGEPFAALSDSLRFKYRFELQDRFGTSIFSQTLDLPAIAGKTLALTFEPATQADSDTLRSFLPAIPAGEAPRPEDLPTSLPGYLVRVQGQFKIDGDTTAEGGSIPLGEEARTAQSLFDPARGWETTTNVVTAGEYHAIGVNGAGVSDAMRARVDSGYQAALDRLSDAVTSGTTPVGLSGDDLTGRMLQGGILSYFAANDTQDRWSARLSGVVSYPMPSYGTFSSYVQTTFSFGVPRTVRFAGVLMDIDRSFSIMAAKDNDRATVIRHNQIRGARLSANEHRIPEILFEEADPLVESISAVKALSVAAREGQRIYDLSSANIAELDSIAVEDAVKADIRASAAAGKQITISEGPIELRGWRGVGYIVFDPETGSGAYRISGGANGAVALILIALAAATLAAILFVLYLEVVAGLILSFFLLVNFIIFTQKVRCANSIGDVVKAAVQALLGFVFLPLHELFAGIAFATLVFGEGFILALKNFFVCTP